MTENNEQDYAKFVEEAYIKPIRSVLIVDDDYPTFTEILSDEENEEDKKKGWRTGGKQSIRNLISQFRKRDPALLLDIHDGTEIDADESESGFAPHLHQSDLLVLDYQLERGNSDGRKSIGIARKLLANPHFNLIVFHTNAELNDTFNNVLFGLLSPAEELNDSRKVDAGEWAIQEMEDDNPSISKLIKKEISTSQYLHFRRRGIAAVKKAVNQEKAPFESLVRVCDDFQIHKRNNKRFNVCLWALKEFEKKLESGMNKDSPSKLTWSNELEGGRRWIRSNRGFVAFTNKAEKVNLIQELQETLETWQPTPTRLISAKLRAEIDEKGVIAEDKSLDNKNIYSAWYLDFLDTEDIGLRTKIDEFIEKQTDTFIGNFKPSLIKFAEQIINNDRKTGTNHEELVEQHFKIDLSKPELRKTAGLDRNAYVCSKSVCGWHLLPGHVLKIANEYWVCVSPACDLVPGQKSGMGIYGHVGDSKKPFLAVLLYTTTSDLDNFQINSNRFVFLNVNGETKQLSFTPTGDDNRDRSPHWGLFIADDSGQFREDKRIKVLRPMIPRTKLSLKEFDAEIVAQLRYEYALNYINRLGTELTRVGLDFSGYRL